VVEILTMKHDTPGLGRCRLSLLLLAVAIGLVTGERIEGTDGEAEPPLTPRLELLAEFMTKTRCPVFDPAEPVSLWVAVDGRRTTGEKLVWSVSDFTGAVKDEGDVAVPAGDDRWSTTLALGDYGAGSFEVHVALKVSGATLPQAGSRPPGFMAYGVLPPIE
jgi:hypothetical protein